MQVIEWPRPQPLNLLQLTIAPIRCSWPASSVVPGILAMGGVDLPQLLRSVAKRRLDGRVCIVERKSDNSVWRCNVFSALTSVFHA